jgi:alpha-N-arabinofuranosidase
MSAARIRIWPDPPKAVINPNIYGHIAEHIGRCVYEGIWVGRRSTIPNEDGVRLDVLAALKQVRAPVIRWPGGCFADAYHWRDGVGPRKSRPLTVNAHSRQAEPNEFGSDEFVQFCRALGSEPCLCVNVGTGSPREAAEWVEYCNYGGDSTLSRLRTDNASGKPYGVKYWRLGDESWGRGGCFAPEDYAREFTRFASAMKSVDPDIRLAASGRCPMSTEIDSTRFSWSHGFCESMSHPELIDCLSVHRCFSAGQATEFSDGDYDALFADLTLFERDIKRFDHMLAYYYPDRHVGLSIDRWGLTHPDADVDNGLEQENTLRDAVFAGAALNLFNRWAHRVSATNIAVAINALQSLAHTDGARMFLTPTYHVFDMMRGHMGARLLTQEVECPSVETRVNHVSGTVSTPALSVSASLAGSKILMTVANQTRDQDIDARIEIHAAAASVLTGRVLNSANPRDVNAFTAQKTVSPKKIKTEPSGGEIAHVFPAHSFTALSITLA